MDKDEHNAVSYRKLAAEYREIAALTSEGRFRNSLAVAADRYDALATALDDVAEAKAETYRRNSP